MAEGGCHLPYWLNGAVYECPCGRTYVAVTFRDDELGHEWQGWDRMPEVET